MVLTNHPIAKAIVITMAFLFPLKIALADDPTLSSDTKTVAVPVQAIHSVYFSLADKHGFPMATAQQGFDCLDKIYTVVELTAYPLGRHELSIRWIDPAQTSREHTQYPFHVRQQNTRLWAWLSLSRATGAGLLQWLNPAAGLEEFIGPWSVEVRIDNNKIASETFEVSC